MRGRFAEIGPGLWTGACPSVALQVHATLASKAVTTAAMLNRWRGHLPAS
jgi:hypothetical protein